MKTLFFSICYLLLCIGILKGQDCDYATKSCKIVSIDTISMYYVVKAINISSKQDTITILSEKIQLSKGCQKLKVGDTYNLTLKITNIIRADEESNIILPDRIFYIDQILICKDGNLPYFVKNLKGICY